MSVDDFKSFIGLTAGDFGGTVIKYYGTPDKTLSTLLEYNEGKDVILSFSLGKYSGKVTQITLVGKRGHDYVNSKKNLTIYPILLVSDRIFEILGLNYILNKWYLDKIKEKLKNKYNSNFIKNLVIIEDYK